MFSLPEILLYPKSPATDMKHCATAITPGTNTSNLSKAHDSSGPTALAISVGLQQ